MGSLAGLYNDLRCIYIFYFLSIILLFYYYDFYLFIIYYLFLFYFVYLFPIYLFIYSAGLQIYQPHLLILVSRGNLAKSD